jgi:hypothetical protein
MTRRVPPSSASDESLRNVARRADEAKSLVDVFSRPSRDVLGSLRALGTAPGLRMPAICSERRETMATEAKKANVLQVGFDV